MMMRMMRMIVAWQGEAECNLDFRRLGGHRGRTEGGCSEPLQACRLWRAVRVHATAPHKVQHSQVRSYDPDLYFYLTRARDDISRSCPCTQPQPGQMIVTLQISSASITGQSTHCCVGPCRRLSSLIKAWHNADTDSMARHRCSLHALAGHVS